MRTRLVSLSAWALLVIGYVAYMRSNDLGVVEAAEELRSAMAGNWWGPVLFVVAYTIRPLVLFPASVLTVLGGLAFGLVGGIVWTVLASNLSTVTTYVAGRTLGTEATAGRLSGLAGGVVGRAVDRPFEATLLMRLLFLPFDLVGYVAGFLRLRFVPFLAGSFLGTVPGTIAFVGFGASIDSLDEGTPSLDLRVVGASLALAAAGSLLSRRLRAAEDARTPAPLEAVETP